MTILGHIQRGGNPTVRDRVLASRLGMAAAFGSHAGKHGVLFGVRGNVVCETPFETALAETKQIDRELLEMVNTLAG